MWKRQFDNTVTIKSMTSYLLERWSSIVVGTIPQIFVEDGHVISHHCRQHIIAGVFRRDAIWYRRRKGFGQTVGNSQQKMKTPWKSFESCKTVARRLQAGPKSHSFYTFVDEHHEEVYASVSWSKLKNRRNEWTWSGRRVSIVVRNSQIYYLRGHGNSLYWYKTIV